MKKLPFRVPAYSVLAYFVATVATAPFAQAQEISVIDDGSGATLSDASGLGDSFYPISGVTSDRFGTDLAPAINLIPGAGVGFDATAPHDNLGAFPDLGAVWVTDDPNGGVGNDFFDPPSAPPARLVFDLGSSVTLNEISLWGYASTTANGAKDVDLRFSNTLTFSGPPIHIAGIALDPTPRQSFNIPEVTARYVELVPTDNHFIAPGDGSGGEVFGGDRVGLSEVAFQSGIVDFGCTQPGSPVTRTFTIRNDSTTDNLILRADGLTLPPGYSMNPAWPTATIIPTFEVVVQKDNAGAAADDSTSLDLIQVPSIISVDDITIKIPQSLVDASNGPDSQTPFIDPGEGIAISQDPLKTTLNFNQMLGGGWECITPGVFSHDNGGDICAEFSGQSWTQGQNTRWQAATLRFRRPVLTGTLDDPGSNGSVFFGFGLAGLNPPRVPGTANDGDAFGQAGIEVSLTIYNSATNMTEVVSGVFQDDGTENNRSSVILQASPVLIPIPVVIPPEQTWEDIVGDPLTVQLDALAEGRYSGDFSLENNDGDEDPFNFPITGLVDGTGPTIVGLPADISAPSMGVSCEADVSWIEPSVTDNFDLAPTIVQTGGLPSGSTFSVGDHVIEYTATDCAGNQTIGTFTVSVSDMTAPTLDGTIPKRIIRSTPPGTTSAIIAMPTLTANDDCDPNPTVVCNRTDGLPLTAPFQLGETEVCCYAEDSSGNVSPTKCFDVIVIEGQLSPSPRTLETIAKREDSVPITGGGTATLDHVYNVFINEAGGIAFRGRLSDAGTGNIGLWKNTGAFENVARKGDLLPGFGVPISNFDEFVLNESGDLAFEVDSAQFNDASGSVVLSLFKGGPTPGGTATYRSLAAQAFDTAGTSYTRANLVTGGGITTANDTGIWRKEVGMALEEIVREGSPTGALPGVDFGHSPARIVVNEGGEIAFSSFLEIGTGGVTTADNTALFAGAPGSLAVVSREGQVAPGPLADAALFQTYAAESINNLGRVAFEGTLKTGSGTPVTSSTNTGLYTNSNGTVELVAREGDQAPCLEGPIVEFASFRDIFITDTGDVFFHAFLRGNMVDSSNDGSFWRWDHTDSTLHPIVREGDIAPSTLDAVFRSLVDFAVTKNGIQAISATLVPNVGDTKGSNDSGLWMDTGSDGFPILKVRRGDTSDIGLGNPTVPTITLVRFDKTTNPASGSGGHGKVVNANGEIVVRMSFNQNSTGAFVLGAPPAGGS